MTNFKSKHGGNLVAASQHFAIPINQWIDLSTGINPCSYPIPAISQKYFHQLPEANNVSLLAAAKNYYQVESLQVAAGSQQIIEVIPQLRNPCRVAIPAVGYQEHLWQWQKHGHDIVFYDGFKPEQLEQLIVDDKVDCVVLINPNNPTAADVALPVLKKWQTILNERNGWLIIDEAFRDCSPEKSFSAFSHLDNVIVLRSVGKFFGLAGIRIGFVLAGEKLLHRINEHLGLWSVSGVSQYIAICALTDREWQQQQQVTLSENSRWMYQLLQRGFSECEVFQTPYFVSVLIDQEKGDAIFNQLASKGMLIRQWSLADIDKQFADADKTLLRFGLLSEQQQASREKLQQLLQTIDSVL
jgi:cobalamin biosynthetic protein CobC